MYILTLKVGKEELKIEVKFKPDGSPDVTSVNSKGPIDLCFDVVCLHRYISCILALSPGFPASLFAGVGATGALGAGAPLSFHGCMSQ